jgi:hypothetical protein
MKDEAASRCRSVSGHIRKNIGRPRRQTPVTGRISPVSLFKDAGGF